MPFTDDPDRLSAIGEQQAADLGRWWARQGISFDEVISGTMERQVRTAEIAGAAMREAGLPYPELKSTPAWNEFDAEGVVKRVLPALAESDATFAALAAAFETNRNSPDQNRHFQRMFEAVMSRWGLDEAGVEGVEPWSAFRARISGALRAIIDDDGTNRRILVVTSGGPIGVAVQTILDAPAKAAVSLIWRIRNCSVSEVLFTRDRASIDSFNLTAHLSRPDLITFR
jgi:broad specificity phosphatase PhoE